MSKTKNGILYGGGKGLPGRFWVSLFLLFFLVSCSDRKVPPPPRAQPELLLEIYDVSRRHDYKTALSKVRKLRALDPNNVFLAELESTVRFNLITAEVNKDIQKGNFDAALYAIQRYETLYGFSDSTTDAKNRLFVLAELDSLVAKAQNAVKSDELENTLGQIGRVSKNIELSPKIKNFLQDKMSGIKRIRKIEHDRMIFGLGEDSLALFKVGDSKTASTMVAVLALEAPDDPRLNELLSCMTAF